MLVSFSASKGVSCYANTIIFSALGTEDTPKSIESGDAATITLVPSKPLSIESFLKFPQLERIAVRDMRETAAVDIKSI